MRWQGRRRSVHVQDRRGLGRGLVTGGGGLIVLIILALVFGVDPSLLLQDAGTGTYLDSGSAPGDADPELTEFVSVVLADTEDVWRDLFEDLGGTYTEPNLVLFSGRVRSACGIAGSAVGPFYCPGDANVYLDLSFFQELHRRFGAPGDFAQAYVIAHEIGHHVQNLLGINEEVRARQRRVSEADANRLSVRLELQADFLAGVWAHHAQERWSILEPGDVEEALGAAAAIGDDRLQQQSQGTVVPDAFTHGTSEQRVRWFRLGLETGDVRQGDTFSATEL